FFLAAGDGIPEHLIAADPGYWVHAVTGQLLGDGKTIEPEVMENTSAASATRGQSPTSNSNITPNRREFFGSAGVHSCAHISLLCVLAAIKAVPGYPFLDPAPPGCHARMAFGLRTPAPRKAGLRVSPSAAADTSALAFRLLGRLR